MQTIKYLFYILHITSASIGISVFMYVFLIFLRNRTTRMFYLVLMLAIINLISLNSSVAFTLQLDLKFVTLIIGCISIFMIAVGPKTLELFLPFSEQKNVKIWFITAILCFVYFILMQFINPKLAPYVFIFQIISILRNSIRAIIVKKKCKITLYSLEWGVMTLVIITSLFLPFKLIFDFPTPLRYILFPNIQSWLRIAPIHYIAINIPLLIFLFKDIKSKKEVGLNNINNFCSIYKLSKREQELIPYLLKGYTYNQIGHFLNISHTTVKTHVEHILQKSNLKNRSEILSSINNYQNDNFENLVKGK